MEHLNSFEALRVIIGIKRRLFTIRLPLYYRLVTIRNEIGFLVYNLVNEIGISRCNEDIINIVISALRCSAKCPSRSIFHQMLELPVELL